MSQRNIVKIDPDKCDGCGHCVDACLERAIQLVDGKAQLISDSYCDGLGACIGHCPQGAITIERRESQSFDPAAVKRHLASSHAANPHSCNCPGSAARSLSSSDTSACKLVNWPIQLRLVPTTAPYFVGAQLIIAADCTAYAAPDFQQRFVNDRTLLIACPKLDDSAFYIDKLTSLFRQNNIAGVEVVHMEVTCCFGLANVVTSAIDASGKSIPLSVTKVGVGSGGSGGRRDTTTQAQQLRLSPARPTPRQPDSQR